MRKAGRGRGGGGDQGRKKALKSPAPSNVQRQLQPIRKMRGKTPRARQRARRGAGTARAPVWTPLLLFSKQRPRGLGTLSAPLPLVTSRWRLHTHKGQGSRRRLIAGGLQSAGCACGTGAVTVAISRKCSLPHLDCQSSRSGPLSSVWRNVGNLK